MTTASDYSENVAAVRTLWKTCSATEDLCLCVSGSVARGEQTPHSDTDFLLLHKDNDTASAAAEDMLRRMHAELEHVSVISRSLAHCRAMIDEDVRSWVSQMDATWVVGSKDLFMAYRTDMCSQAEQSHRNLLTD